MPPRLIASTLYKQKCPATAVRLIALHPWATTHTKGAHHRFRLVFSFAVQSRHKTTRELIIVVNVNSREVGFSRGRRDRNNAFLVGAVELRHPSSHPSSVFFSDDMIWYDLAIICRTPISPPQQPRRIYRHM